MKIQNKQVIDYNKAVLAKAYNEFMTDGQDREEK